MKLEVKDNCPLDNFNPCRAVRLRLVHEGAGQQPQHGRTHRGVGMSMAWLPILLIENAPAVTVAGAAVESFRNEMVSANQENLRQLKQAQIEEQRHEYLTSS